MCSIFDVLEPQHLPHTGNVEEMKLEHWSDKEISNLLRNIISGRNQMSIIIILNLIKTWGRHEEHHCLDYFWRIEVQQRGSLHLHGIFWMKSMPMHNERNSSKLSEKRSLIDRYNNI